MQQAAQERGRPERAVTVPLIGGHPILDFLNTVEFRGQRGEMDHLGGYDPLVRWLARSGLVPRSIVPGLLSRARRDSAQAQRVWHVTARLRSDLYVICIARARRQIMPVAPLNRVAALWRRANRTSILGVQRNRPEWVRDGTDLYYPAWRLVEASVDFLCGKAFGEIHKCANAPCDWMFLDTSRNHGRRWCEMRTCGNQRKVLEYRKRQRTR